MTRPFVAAALLAAPAALAVEPVAGARLGTEPGEISAALAGSGYAMTTFERERARIEVTATREDRRVGAYLDPESGTVSRVETRTRRGPRPLPGAEDAEIRARLEADGYRI